MNKTNSTKKFAFFVAVLACSAAAMACGGGGDDSTAPAASAAGSAGVGGGTAGQGGSAAGAAGSGGAAAGAAGSGGAAAGAAGSGGAAAGAAGAAASAGSTAGAAGAAGASACGSLVNGPAVLPTYLAAAEPAPQGGTIVDGLYHLTALVHYQSPNPGMGNDPTYSALQFSGGAVQLVTKNKSDPEDRTSYTYAVNGTKIQLTNVCPKPGAGDAIGYTATSSASGTIVKLYLDAEYVYTKQ